MNIREKQIHSRESREEKEIRVDTADTTIRHGGYHGMRVEVILQSSPIRQSHDVESRERARSCGISRVSSSSSEASFILILPVFIILIAQIHYL